MNGGVPRGPIVGVGARCVEVADGSDVHGTPVQLGQCTGAVYQTWTIPGDGSVRTLGKCLAVTGGAAAGGIPVEFYECTDTGAPR